MLGVPPEVLAVGGALFVIAALEAVPTWGRSVPGHLGLAIVAAIAVALAWAPPWLAAPAILGAVVSDAAFFTWYRFRPLHGVWRRRWWRAGLDVDDLSERVRERTFAATMRAKFATRERARLPYAAARSGASVARLALASLVANLVWASTWVLAGALIGGVTRVLPSEGDFVVLAVSLVTLATLVSKPAAGNVA